MLAVHHVGVVEGFGVGDPSFLLVEDVALGVALVDDDAGTDGCGLGETLVGDFHAGEVAAAVLGDETGLADGITGLGGQTAEHRRKGTGGHGHADGEAQGAIVEDFCFLVIEWIEKTPSLLPRKGEGLPSLTGEGRGGP